jgi:glucose/arabinose dehydrogenase
MKTKIQSRSPFTSLLFKSHCVFCLILLTLATNLNIIQAATAEKIATDIAIPWGMTQLPGGELLITERSGTLYLLKADGTKQSISGLPVITNLGQGGLLDVILHPKYQENGWIYLSYSSSEGEGEGANTAIIRAKIKGTTLTDIEQLYKASPNSKKGQHFGSRLAFDDAGYLYFSVGDRGNRSVNPQGLTRDGGKIYRLHDDGKIPVDNPFVTSSKPAVYSYGHRNPQGMAKHPKTGEIWAHEHGPRGGDEVNIIAAGKNYGWPVISYGINYNGTSFTEITKKEGMEQPIYYWDPSIAPSGMAFVTGDKYPEWKGHLLVGSLKFNYLVLCKLEGNKIVATEIVQKDIGRVRNVVQLADGFIYVATDNDAIYRLNP